jgi:hypothetical protein
MITRTPSPTPTVALVVGDAAGDVTPVEDAVSG